MSTLTQSGHWLFSRNVDLSVFLGSAVVSLLLLAVGWQLGILNDESPDWTWITAVLLIDVAHVWSTSFRVYFDTEELKRRLWLYVLVPVAAYAVGVALYSEGELNFWRVLAIVAVFHFVRQQYGWVALYRRKVGETERCLSGVSAWVAWVVWVALATTTRHCSRFVDQVAYAAWPGHPTRRESQPVLQTEIPQTYGHWQHGLTAHTICLVAS